MHRAAKAKTNDQPAIDIVSSDRPHHKIVESKQIDDQGENCTSLQFSTIGTEAYTHRLYLEFSLCSFIITDKIIHRQSQKLAIAR